MKLSTSIAAAAITVLPAVASAAVVQINNGGTTVLSGFNDDVYEFVVNTNDGGFTHTFTVATDGEGQADVSINSFIAPFFEGVLVQWIANGKVVAGGSAGEIVSTTFVDPSSLTQTLAVSWTDAPADSGFDGAVVISAVPVPAGLVLMGTALAGFGALRRRK